ncbi:hypothetical protein [Sphingobium sufflavum]|nr:hypothetical protein [Sphingobium sufflavum]
MSRNITGLTTTDESGNPTNLNLQSGYRVTSQTLQWATGINRTC